LSRCWNPRACPSSWANVFTYALCITRSNSIGPTSSQRGACGRGGEGISLLAIGSGRVARRTRLMGRAL
jgi:hypothetical protein